MLTFLGQAAHLTEGTLHFRLHDVLVDEEYAAAVATYRATRPGQAPLENNLVHLMCVGDGRVSDSWFHSRNQYEVDEFWAP